ncbi:RNA polymerase sigma-I factor [Chungangia koreensis]|uniref:RNA polymerase sigma-I factor n=1 Tax=Chungangia koreensis TaxID=752657 RepID=UPI003673557C
MSTIYGFFKRNNNSDTSIEETVVEAQNGSEKAVDAILVSYTPFVKKTASLVCKKYITDQDDEYSIALLAFHEAIVKYKNDRNASFLTFAHLLIKRKLIDHIRKEVRVKEVSFGMADSDSDEPDLLTKFEHSSSIEHFTEEQRASDRREEMQRYGELLESYGLSFEELVSVSPKHADARQTAIEIAEIIAGTEEFNQYVIEKKRLPIKELEELVEVSRKTIERQRKYILALVLLLGSDFEVLKEYLKGRM